MTAVESGFLPADADPLMLQGVCADGKTFRAELGVFYGTITYLRDGQAVGSVRYGPIILKCECGGGGHSGDVVCADPTAETLEGRPFPQSLVLPFADGKRANPCLCSD